MTCSAHKMAHASGPETLDRTVLAARGLTKSFGESIALFDVDLDMSAGRVLGLVGENGAGKSTLLNILSGLLAPDRGSVDLPGRGALPLGFSHARALGVARVFQEQALIGPVPVFENLLLGTDADYLWGGFMLNRRRMIEVADAMMREAGLALDVRKSTSDLNFSQRQLVEIIRACLGPPMLFGIDDPIVLLDEPTASLERGDEEIFLSLVERTRKTGSLLLVSHRLGEVLRLSDEIVVLKDGHRVASVGPSEADEHELHRLMVGRERDRQYYREDLQRDGLEAEQCGSPALAARGLTRPGAYWDIGFSVAPGEVLGIGGLLESGKTELGKGLAGVEVPALGEVSLHGGPWERPVIGELVANGVGYIPAERLVEGMIVAQSVAWNITLPSGDLFSTKAGLWRHQKERETGSQMIDRMGVKADGPDARCDRLSGGNQQKVVLARWLARDLRVLILDNPTRGVDAGAKGEIYALIRELTDTGVAIVLITDELLELIGMSNRIAIMRHGRVTSILPAPADAKPGEQALVRAMLVDPGSHVADERLSA